MEKYYDSLFILRIIRWLILHGASQADAACSLGHQMCPQVALRCGQAVTQIGKRFACGLTGRSVAGLLAHIPVEDTVFDRLSVWRPFGFQAAGRAWCVSTWVDKHLLSIKYSCSRYCHPG